MAQTEIELPDSLATSKIYAIVNSEDYANNIHKSNEGNKSAKRRLRKQLLEITKLAKQRRKELNEV